jgi:hypothetical protein
VAVLVVPSGDAQDVEVVAQAPSAGLGLALTSACRNGDELGCAASAALTDGSGYVARTIARALAPGAYPLYVSGLADDSVQLSVRYSAASAPPENETCGTAIPITPGEGVQASLVGVKRDLASACSSAGGELVYRVDLSEASDLTVSVFSLDAFGTPFVSLRNAHCREAKDEIDCRSGAQRLFARALPAGTYFLAVGSTGPTDVQLRVDLTPASDPPAGDQCASAQTAESGAAQSLDLNQYANDVDSACLAGGVDASFALDITEPSDVLLVERISASDMGALNLLKQDCQPQSSYDCESSTDSPVRARAQDLSPGRYVAVAESLNATPIEFSAFVRSHVPETLVAFSDACADALLIPETGGRFSGNTTNAAADFDASCDYGGVSSGGADDQLLRLVVTSRRRMVFDLAGSQFATILVVRGGGPCPGKELDFGCAPGRGPSRSFLDLTLDPGEYFVQIDGYARAAGPWVLDVYSE